LKALEVIKKRIWDYRISKVAEANKDLERKFINLYDAKSVVVLFTFTEEKEFLVVMDFLKDLLRRQIQIKALGYIPYKIRPAYVQPNIFVNYLTPAEAAWGKLQGSMADDTAQVEADLLIDLTMTTVPALRYVAAMSRARLRIGSSDKSGGRFHDIMLDVQKISTLDEYLRQIIHYLTSIKAKE
jgi:hypothetical protein